MKVWITARFEGDDQELIRDEAIRVRRAMVERHKDSAPEVKVSNVIFYSNRPPFYGTPNRGPQLDAIIEESLQDMRQAQRAQRIATDPDYGLYLRLKERYEGRV